MAISQKSAKKTLPTSAQEKSPGFRLEQSVTYRLHSLSKLTDRQSQAAYLDEAGIPLSEGRCLAAIGAQGHLSVNDLAASANLNKGQASRAAQTLVDQGLVCKSSSATDRRGVYLSLSPQGARVWRQLSLLIQRRNAEITACLSVKEAAQLDRILDRLLAHARATAQES